MQVVFRCPVTDAYTRYVRKWTAFDELMHEAILVQLRRVEEELGDQAGNTTRVQQLRCFLCIEIMVKLSKRTRLPQRFDRSWNGLSVLRGLAVLEYEELAADTLDRAFGGLDFSGMEQVRHATENRSKRVLQSIDKACVILRRSLRSGSSRRLWTIGKELARVCKVVDELPSMRVTYAEMLVNTTEQQARRLWEQ